MLNLFFQNIDIEQFILRLRETATWLEFVTPYNGSKLYRSMEIKPKELLLEINRDNIYDFYECEKKTVNEVLSVRGNLLKEKAIPLLSVEEVIQRGYLLYASINESVLDGASEAESNCLFDVYDTPAWDTWVWWYEKEELLVSWIPESQVAYAEGAIAVNCVDCIHWAANVPNSLTKKLAKYGLIRLPDIQKAGEPDLKDFPINTKILQGINDSIKAKNK